jgi:hypothetical protein
MAASWDRVFQISEALSDLSDLLREKWLAQSRHFADLRQDRAFANGGLAVRQVLDLISDQPAA